MNANQARTLRIVARLIATSSVLDRATGDAVVIVMAAGMATDPGAGVFAEAA